MLPGHFRDDVKHFWVAEKAKCPTLLGSSPCLLPREVPAVKQQVPESLRVPWGVSPHLAGNPDSVPFPVVERV